MAANLTNILGVRHCRYRTPILFVVFNGGMASSERHQQIVEAVRAEGRLGVAELAALTGASEMTVRRDLEILAGQGVLERYRGGARSLLLRGEEPPFALRETESRAVKQRIAAEVAALVADGETVVLDSGTTCLEVARVLQQRRLTVMPLSLHAANALTGAARLRLIIPGASPAPANSP